MASTRDILHEFTSRYHSSFLLSCVTCSIYILPDFCQHTYLPTYSSRFHRYHTSLWPTSTNTSRQASILLALRFRGCALYYFSMTSITHPLPRRANSSTFSTTTSNHRRDGSSGRSRRRNAQQKVSRTWLQVERHPSRLLMQRKKRKSLSDHHHGPREDQLDTVV